MSIWDKLFGHQKNQPDSEESNAPSEAEQAKLEGLVKPLIRPTTQIILKPSSSPPENSYMRSHFGGQPYFEAGESWPQTKAGAPLPFIFQIFNTPELELPDSIALVQFYYDWYEGPWDTGDDGWHIKIYKELKPDLQTSIPPPEGLDTTKYCEMAFLASHSLPDWEGIYEVAPAASQLSSALHEDEPWKHYEQVVTQLIGPQTYRSQLGGYPRWVQGESTPLNGQEKPMKLLFQIDSEDEAGLVWGDMGLIYVFYEEETERVAFTLQCH